MVILITGETTTAVAIEAIRQGAYDYIIKPFELDDVQSSVERALATWPDAANIYERNIKTLRGLGHAGWRALWIEVGDSAAPTDGAVP